MSWLKSRKTKYTLFGTIFTTLIQLSPLPQEVKDLLTKVITILSGIAIGGVAVEDFAAKWNMPK